MNFKSLFTVTALLTLALNVVPPERSQYYKHSDAKIISLSLILREKFSGQICMPIPQQKSKRVDKLKKMKNVLNLKNVLFLEKKY